MERSRLVALVVGALVALLLVTVATAEPARITARGPSLPWDLPEIDLRIDVPPTLPADDAARDDTVDEPSRPWQTFTDLVQLALAALSVVAAGYLLRHAWRRRPDFGWSREAPPDDFVVLDDLAEGIVADAASQRALLRTGTARNAIVACWLRLEDAVEAAGIEPDPALTSAELTAQVLGRFDVDPEAVERLAALYREARFSTHRLDGGQREAAIEALDAIHDGLRSTGVTAP